MNNLLQISMFTLSLISFLAGLFIAPFFGIVSLFALLKIRSKIIFKEFFLNKNLQIIFILLTYTLLSIFILFTNKSSYFTLSTILLIQFGYFILDKLINQNKVFLKDQLFKPLILAVLVAIVIMFFEVLTQGLLFRTIRIDIFKSKNYGWFLSDLNRGISFINLLLWPIVFFISENYNKKIAVTFYIIVTTITLSLDSMASGLAVILSSIIFVIIRYLPNLYNIFRYLTLSSIFLIPLLYYYIDKNYVLNNFHLPASAEHRVYIWDYVSNLIFNNYFHTIFGYGFNVSRFWEADISTFHPLFGSSLPLHPHSNILQIAFELGYVGLVFYALIVNKVLKPFIKEKGKVKSYIAAAFSNYFVIANISYGLWQQWWLASIIFAILLTKIVLLHKEN
ncbi:MAG: O-antigen ligase family protein [Sphingobacteriia bacterium]|nr:O-antigen ligase family protein [Sphingobacteriia bacterium]